MKTNTESIAEIVCDNLNYNCGCSGMPTDEVYGGCRSCWAQAYVIALNLDSLNYGKLPENSVTT